MNAYYSRALALLVILAGAAQANESTPPPPASPADAPAPAAPAAPAAPPALDNGSTDRASREMDRESRNMERELQRAQQELDRAAREVAELSSKLGAQAWSQFKPGMEYGPPRAMLGINIGNYDHDHDHDSDADSNDGVRIVSVSPGGPADQAGLKANDLIVSIGGEELQGDSKASREKQLLAAMRRAEPDKPIEVGYRRKSCVGKDPGARLCVDSSKVKKVNVVPKSLEEFTMEAVSDAMNSMHDFNPMKDRTIRIWSRDPGGFGSAELADLSPGLGKYFGTDKGLLVVRAPTDERLKLQDGDVLLDIDGRAPGSPSHAYEILSSYRSGETMKLHVMRQQKKLELPVEVPEDGGNSGSPHLRAAHPMQFDLISPNTYSIQ
jgi:C-terminal processing protease CtpA/Prc